LDDYFQQSISELIKLSESEFLEFKSTLKWDIRLEKANPELVGEIIKTIAGFLNNKGGVLVIGYDDDNNVLYGLEKDYPVTSKKSNYDGWQQYFINQVNERLGKEINHYFTIEPIPHDGKTIARINVSKSPKPVFAKQNKQGGDFFVRIHGQTENLNPEDTNNWIKEHFSN
jgi:predicted HTH transcriptional regulator